MTKTTVNRRMKRLALQKPFTRPIQYLQADMSEMQKTDDLSLANTPTRIILLPKDKRLVTLAERYAGQMKPLDETR